jgi:autotransporter-associated beta strand protein
VIGGSVGFTKDGPGDIEIAGLSANTISGPTSVVSGTLRLNKPAGIRAFNGPLIVGDTDGKPEQDYVILMASNQIPDNVPITINSTGYLDLNGYDETIGPLTIVGAYLIGPGSTFTPTAGITSTFTPGFGFASSEIGVYKMAMPPEGVTVFVDRANHRLYLDSIIVGGSKDAKFTKTGPGALDTSSLQNDYTAETVVQDGVYRPYGSPEFGSLTNRVTVTGNGGLDFKLAGQTASFDNPLTLSHSPTSTRAAIEIPGPITWNGPITVTDQGSFQVIPGGELTVTHGITGFGSLVKYGIGPMNIAATRATFSNGPGLGSTAVISEGTLRLLLYNTLPPKTSAEVKAGAVLEAHSFEQYLDVITGKGSIALFDSVNLAVGNANGSSVFDGVISGQGSLGKYGSGSLTVTGHNTFSGNVYASGNGQLIISNSTGTAFTSSFVDIQGVATLMLNNTGGAVTPPSGSIGIHSDGTITGTGATGGELHITAGGRAAPGTIGNGTLSVPLWDSANLSSLRFRLGAQDAPANSRVQVDGTLNLDGVISIEPVAGFHAGTYRLFDYGGALIEHEVLFENVPSGYTFVLDKSVPGQINLIVTGGSVNEPGSPQALVYLPATPVNLITQ